LSASKRLCVVTLGCSKKHSHSLTVCGPEINRRSSERCTHLCSFPIASFFVSLVTTRYCHVTGFGRTKWRKEMCQNPPDPNNEQRWLSVSGPRGGQENTSFQELAATRFQHLRHLFLCVSISWCFCSTIHTHIICATILPEPGPPTD
jgi:hypothetical protein